MHGEMSRAEAEAFATAAAAIAAAAAASLPDQDGQHNLSHSEVLALQAHPDEEDAEGFDATHDGQGQARKPRKLRKPNDVARCQVDGCGRDLSDAKLYLRRYSVCEPHFKAEWVTLGGGRYRFCQQCNKFQSLDNFSGNRRSCKARSEDRNLRRRKQRTDERAMAGADDADGVAGRLLKGGTPLGGLALPSRAALCDNGVLRQLANDPNDPANQLAAAQYATQVQQLLIAGAGGVLPAGAAVAAGGGGGLGGQMPVPGMDLAALVGADFNGLAAAQSANALSLLIAGAAANGTAAAGRGGGHATGDPAVAAVGGNVLHQLQLAHLASALTKGAAIGGAAAAAAPAAPPGGAVAAAGGLAAALGGMGLGLGLGSGGLSGALNGAGNLALGAAAAGALNGAGNIAQQLLLQQAAAAAGAGGAAAGGAGPGGAGPVVGVGPLGEAGGSSAPSAPPPFPANLDLQSLMAQQLIQQTAGGGGGGNHGGPLVLLSNQNVMLLSLDQLGLLQQPPQPSQQASQQQQPVAAKCE